VKIIKFGASWCAPCRAMRPIMEKFKTKYPDMTIEEHDLDNSDSYKLSEKLGCRAVPTLIWMRDGKDFKKNILLKLEGAAPLRAVEDAHERAALRESASRKGRKP